jgi:hypothetical protein
MNPIDVVYILGPTPDSDFLEFRLSLRSLCKHYGDNIRNVFTIGHKPAWLRNTEHIPFLDAWSSKDAILMSKALYACYRKEISDPFLMMSDDIFLMRPLAGLENKVYAEDLPEETWRNWASSRNAWSRRNYATREIVKHRYADEYPQFIDPHVGVFVFKDHYVRTMLQVGWEFQKSNAGLNTNYYQYACLYDDKLQKTTEKLGVRLLNKVGKLPNAEEDKEMLWLNVGDESVYLHPGLFKYLLSTFNESTKYEDESSTKPEQIEEVYLFAKDKYRLAQADAARAQLAR